MGVDGGGWGCMRVDGGVWGCMGGRIGVRYDGMFMRYFVLWWDESDDGWILEGLNIQEDMLLHAVDICSIPTSL